MKKVMIVVSGLLVLLMIFSFVFCKGSIFYEGTKTKSAESKELASESIPTEERFTIGWSVYNSAYEYFSYIQQGVLDKAEELGINVIIHDQKSDTAEMIRGVTNLIEQGIDALVISPFNPEAMILLNDLIKEAGIPVIVVDMGYGDADVDALIVSDSFGGGVLAGEYALQLIGEHALTSKNAAIIKAEETAIYAIRRGEGFKSVMIDSGYQIAAEITANGDPTLAYEAMKEILATYGDDLAVLFAENDRMALGAAQAIEEAGKTGQIMVIGFDGIQSALEAIKAGLMQGTIAQQPYAMGELGVELANTLLTGGTIRYDDRTTKELYMEVFLIDETGEVENRVPIN